MQGSLILRMGNSSFPWTTCCLKTKTPLFFYAYPCEPHGAPTIGLNYPWFLSLLTPNPMESIPKPHACIPTPAAFIQATIILFPSGLYLPTCIYSLQCVFQLQLVSSLQNADLIMVKVKESESEVAQSCPTLCDPVDCSLPGFSVHGILQARILEWVTISFSSRSSQPRDWTQVFHIGGRHLNLWATREALWSWYLTSNLSRLCHCFGIKSNSV